MTILHSEQDRTPLAKRLQSAVNAHVNGQLFEAEQQYQQILDDSPDNATAMHFLGLLYHQTQRRELGLALVLRSIERQPPHAEWLNNLGNIYVERNELQEAIKAFSRSVAIDARQANVWNNLGSVYQRCEQVDDAAFAFRYALLLDANHLDALYNYGHLLTAQGKQAQASEYLCRAYINDTRIEKTRAMLGTAYYRLGRIEAAANIYRLWLDEEPNNPTAQHLYAACGGKDAPSRAPDQYIEATFDNYADHFEHKLVAQLAYSGPELIARALSKIVPADAELTSLDLGCGTGLCGPILRPFSRQLTGVDLSQKMLDLAEKRGVYDALQKMELTAFLRQHPQSADLVVAADTFIYFGDLRDALSAVAQTLNDGGILVFTVESHADGSAYKINPHGRYSHNHAYVVNTLEKFGLALVAADTVTVRKEFGMPVAGLLVTCKK